MAWQIAIYDRWTTEYRGALEWVGGGVCLFDDKDEAVAFAGRSNKHSAILRYEACEHHDNEARK